MGWACGPRLTASIVLLLLVMAPCSNRSPGNPPLRRFVYCGRFWLVGKPLPKTCNESLSAWKKRMQPKPAPLSGNRSMTPSTFLRKQLAKLQQDIDNHVDRHPDLRRDMELLTSIPAVGRQTGTNLLAIVQGHRFDSAEQLAAYLGLVPVEKQSGSSVLGRTRLSKAGPPRIRAILYMPAVVATKYNPHVKTVYDRLVARGKAKMAALGAAMRKLVHLSLASLKPACTIKRIMQKTVDFQDGICGRNDRGQSLDKGRSL